MEVREAALNPATTGMPLLLFFFFFFKMSSYLTQADLKLSIQLRPWRSVYSRRKEDLESRYLGSQWTEKCSFPLRTGLISIVTTETLLGGWQWNTVLRRSVLFFRNSLHNKQIWPASTWRLDDDIQKFYLNLHNLFCKPAYISERVT